MSERDFRKVDVLIHDTRSDCYGMVLTETEVDTAKWDDGKFQWVGGDYVPVEDYLEAVDEIDRLRMRVKALVVQNEGLMQDNLSIRARMKELEREYMKISEGWFEHEHNIIERDNKIKYLQEKVNKLENIENFRKDNQV